MKYSFAQLERLWIDAGGPGALAPLMAAIALAESRGESDALNPDDNNGTQTSVGLWQVSTGTHQYPADWTSPVGNAKAAVDKWRTDGLGAWGTYISGAYKQYLQGNVPPAAGLPPAPSGTAGGGLISSITGDIFGLLSVPLGILKGVGDVPAAILALAAPFVKIAEAIDWLLHPSHWIRIFAGLAGGVLVLGGVWQLTHAGGA